MIEFIEVLKLDVAFLRAAGASQEHHQAEEIPQTFIDEVILGTRTSPNTAASRTTSTWRSCRHRTVKVAYPYITRLRKRSRSTGRTTTPGRSRKHIAPHTIEMAASGRFLTRLEEPKKHNLSVMQKLKLYNGSRSRATPRTTSRSFAKRRAGEGMDGIPRYVQDKISNALVAELDQRCVNPSCVLERAGGRPEGHSLITSEEQRQRSASFGRRAPRVRGHRQERGAARHRRRRAAISRCAGTTSTSRRTRRRRKSETRTLVRTKSPTSG